MEGAGYIKETKELIEKLRQIPVLSSFHEEDLKGFLKLSRMIKYPPGELIIEEGQIDNWIYFLIAGKVGIIKQGKTINVLRRRGDLFGEMGIIDSSPRSASIMAIDETVCLAVDASYMDRLEGHDRVAFAAVLYRVFSEILAVRLRQADERMIEMKAENEKLKAALSRRQQE